MYRVKHPLKDFSCKSEVYEQQTDTKQGNTMETKREPYRDEGL